jgi:hypothetical protein
LTAPPADSSGDTLFSPDKLVSSSVPTLFTRLFSSLPCSRRLPKFL